MATISERFRVDLTGGPASSIESMTVNVKTYGKGVAEAVTIVQNILGEAQDVLDGVTIANVERTHE